MSVYLTHCGDCDICSRSLESKDGEVTGPMEYVLEMAGLCGWEIAKSDPDIMPGLLCESCQVERDRVKSKALKGASR